VLLQVFGLWQHLGELRTSQKQPPQLVALDGRDGSGNGHAHIQSS
jgi:hypothetical protein